jgi:hypothetical protein
MRRRGKADRGGGGEQAHAAKAGQSLHHLFSPNDDFWSYIIAFDCAVARSHFSAARRTLRLPRAA